MLRKLTAIFAIVLLWTLKPFAQQSDTLRIMQYNLLYYGLYTDFCTEDNNNVAQKTEYLKTIVQYVKPDVFGVNEINANEYYQDYLLNNVFILNGFPTYTRSIIVGTSGYLTTQIFYNRAKLREKAVYILEDSESPRPTVLHKFYLVTESLRDGDTIWLYIAEAHLKAGSDYADVRCSQISAFMDSLQNFQPGNFIIMGDLNLYSSSECAYQALINPNNTAYAFVDPGPAGSWHENSSYAQYHTQSTVVASQGCKVTGGLDDRFDFILYSKAINDNIYGLSVIPQSFRVIGNDGNHFNQSIDYNGNSSVPEEVLQALVNNSDHLPVYIELKSSSPFTSVDLPQAEHIPAVKLGYSAANPNTVNIYINTNQILLAPKAQVKIVGMDGKIYKIFTLPIDHNQIRYQIDVSDLSTGVYVLQFSVRNKIYPLKFVKF